MVSLKDLPYEIGEVNREPVPSVLETEGSLYTNHDPSVIGQHRVVTPMRASYNDTSPIS